MARAVFNTGGMEEQKGPTFFKIIKPGFNTEHLRIPPAFRKHILSELSVRATLTLNSSADSSWNVRAHKIGRNIYLKEGWEEFLRDNSFGDSEFLVFRYDGIMHFSIDVFEKNGCIRTEAPAIIRHQQSSVTHNTKRRRGRPGKHGNPAEQVVNGEFSNSTKRRRVRPRTAEHTRNGESSTPIVHTGSKFPAFTQTISKVYTVNVPTRFCKKHLPAGHYIFILQNTEGDTWEVSANPSNKQVVLCGWMDGFCTG